MAKAQKDKQVQEEPKVITTVKVKDIAPIRVNEKPSITYSERTIKPKKPKKPKAPKTPKPKTPKAEKVKTPAKSQFIIKEPQQPLGQINKPEKNELTDIKPQEVEVPVENTPKKRGRKRKIEKGRDDAVKDINNNKEGNEPKQLALPLEVKEAIVEVLSLLAKSTISEESYMEVAEMLAANKTNVEKVKDRYKEKFDGVCDQMTQDIEKTGEPSKEHVKQADNIAKRREHFEEIARKRFPDKEES